MGKLLLSELAFRYVEKQSFEMPAAVRIVDHAPISRDPDRAAVFPIPFALVVLNSPFFGKHFDERLPHLRIHVEWGSELVAVIQQVLRGIVAKHRCDGLISRKHPAADRGFENSDWGGFEEGMELLFSSLKSLV